MKWNIKASITKARERMQHLPWRSWLQFSWLETSLEKVVSILVKLGTILLVVFLLSFFLRLFRDQGYVIQPFSMPKKLEEQGMNGQVFALRLQESLEALKQEAGSVKEDSLELKEVGQDLDLSVLGVGLSLQSFAFQVREVLGRDNKTLRGEVIRLDDKLAARVRMTGYSLISKEVVVTEVGEGQALEELLRELAEGLLFETDPYRLALVLRKEDRDKEAIEAIRHIIRTRPQETHWAYLAWGVLLKEKGDYAGSIKKYESALEIEPGFTLAWYNMANSLREIDRIPEAIDAMNKVLELEPENIWRWTSYGWLLHNAELYEEVDSIYPVLLARSNLTEQEHIALASTWTEMKIQRGETESARAIINEHFTDDLGETAFSYQVRGVLALMDQDTAQCVALIGQALEIDPSDQSAVSLNINILNNIAHYRQAADVYYKADWDYIREESKVYLFNEVANAMNGVGVYDTAQMIVRQAIEINPVLGFLYATLAETHAYTGQVDSFFHYFEYSLQKGFKLEYVEFAEEPYKSLIAHPEMQRLIRQYERKEEELAQSIVDS